MKKLLLAGGIASVLLSSCEIEYRGVNRYHHYRGYERRHYPDHRHMYDRGYRHDEHGGQIIVVHPR